MASVLVAREDLQIVLELAEQFHDHWADDRINNGETEADDERFRVSAVCIEDLRTSLDAKGTVSEALELLAWSESRRVCQMLVDMADGKITAHMADVVDAARAALAKAEGK